MNARLTITSFVIGLIALAVWVTVSILWMMHIELEGFTFSFFVAAAAILFLLGLGFTYRDKDRWLAFTLAGILLTGLSLSWLYSLGGFLLPLGIILLAISLSKLAVHPRIGAELMIGIAGGVWAIIVGLLSTVRFLFFSQPTLDSSGLIRQMSVFYILVLLAGVMALVAIYQYTRRPRLSLVLIWLCITGIVITFWTLARGSIGFEALTTLILLIPAATKMSRAPSAKTTSQPPL